jgi:hypothetical protein
MAAEISRLDMRARPRLAVLFNQVGKRFVDECLDLPAFVLCESADSRQDGAPSCLPPNRGRGDR